MSNESPAIYIAFWPVSKYMKNSVYGAWIEVLGKCPQEIEGEIDRLIDLIPVVISKTTKAIQNVQWAIHDFRGFLGIEISEEESLDRVVEMAKGVVEYGEPYSQYCQATDDSWIEAFLASPLSNRM
jgi:antirestriction protein